MRIAASLAVLALVGAAHGVDIAQPAVLTLTVKDADGKPVPGAVIAVHSAFGKLPKATAITNEAGVGVLQVSAPGMEVVWTSQIDVDKGPALHFEGTTTLFPKAQIQMPVTLWAATQVRVVGPKGEPAPNVPLMFEYILANSYGLTQYDERNDPALRTDERGQFLWRHPTLKTFDVWAGGKKTSFPATDKVTVTLSQEQYQRALNNHVIEGKLLLPDGKGAADWQVVSHTERYSGGGVSSGIAIPMDVYRGDEVQHPKADGSFRITAPSNFLALLSPEGVPFVYLLAPWTWTDNPHRLVLTTPARTGTVDGQLEDQAGKPMAGVRVSVNAMQTPGGMWRLQLGEGGSAGAFDNYLENVTVGKVVSDAQGHFAYPQYAGAKHDGSYIFGEASEYYSRERVGVDAQLTLQRYATGNRPPGAMKDVTVRFVDSKGEDAKDMRFAKVTAAPVNDGQWDGVPVADDVHGWHCFVPVGARELNFEFAEGAWKPVKRTVALGGAEDQSLEVKLADELRNKPLRGRVLDADGKSIAGARVMVMVKIAQPVSAAAQYQAAGMVTYTDAQGGFSFAAVPDDCRISVSMDDWMQSVNLVPGLPLISVGADHQDLEVRVPRGGGVRVLLPEDVPSQLAVIEGTVPARPEQMLYGDPRDHSLVAHGLEAGEWHLTKDALPSLGDFSMEKLAVVAGKETVLDLRNRKPPAAATEKAKTWVNVAVTRDGKPVAGAEVAVFKLPVDATRPDITVMDLADAAGKIRFDGLAGQSYLIVARQREVAGGFATLTAQAGKEGSAEIVMQAAQSLPPTDAVDLPKLVKSADQRWGENMWGASREDADQ